MNAFHELFFICGRRQRKNRSLSLKYKTSERGVLTNEPQLKLAPEEL